MPASRSGVKPAATAAPAGSANTCGTAIPAPAESGLAIPLQRRLRAQVLSRFGTPADITLAELALESSHPADEQTAVVLRV